MYRGGGRPSITSETIDTIVDCLEKGNTIKTAAVKAGITARTFYYWMKKGDEAFEARLIDPDALITPFDDAYIEFFMSVKGAEAEVKRFLLDRIWDAGIDQWQANAWILERRFPEEFSLRKDIRVQHDKHEVIEVELRIGGVSHKSPPKAVPRPDGIPPIEHILDGRVYEADYEVLSEDDNGDSE